MNDAAPATLAPAPVAAPAPAGASAAPQVEVRIDRIVIESGHPLRAEQLEVDIARELQAALLQRAANGALPESGTVQRLAGGAIPAATEAGALARNLARQLVNGVWPQ